MSQHSASSHRSTGTSSDSTSLASEKSEKSPITDISTVHSHSTPLPTSKAPEVPEKLALVFAQKRADPAPSNYERISEWISLYRCFHFFVLSLNSVGVALVFTGHWEDGRRNIATIALANVLAALLIRNELFLRGLFNTVLFLFSRWPPLIFRHYLAGSIQNIGGFHSGFAVSGTMWIIASTAEFYQAAPGTYHVTTKAFSAMACIVLIIVCLAAMPPVREAHHNVFENLHRLMGWFCLTVVWSLVGTTTAWSAADQRFYASQLARSPNIWLALAITIIIYIPWFTLKKVPVKSEVLSKSIIRIHFPEGCHLGLFGRISRHPLRENHAFGITSRGPDSGEHYMVVVAQGDWTRGLVDRPPTHLWTRAFKFVGLPYLNPLYNSGLFVVTGSAIGVGLPAVFQPLPKSRWHLLWVSSNIEKTYGDNILKEMREQYGHDEQLMANNVTIWDTREKGRPNLGELISGMVDELKVESVLITSNPKGTADILRACRRRGIPAHGPIWDS